MSGRSRTRAAFAAARREGRCALIPYFVGGWPSFRRSGELLWEAQEAGASIIELGIPFSDPVADGPVLQAAMHEALQKGVTVRKILDFVRSLRREGLTVPVLGMTYANLLFKPGYQKAAQRWASAGLDGAIVPDVPEDEAAPLRGALRRQGLVSVAFASPSTDPGRLRRIVRAPDGFVYLVSVYGTTGARKSIAPETRSLLKAARRARGANGPPLCVGFGVSTPEHVRGLHRLGADGVIVGSALARRIREGGGVRRYLSMMAKG